MRLNPKKSLKILTLKSTNNYVGAFLLRIFSTSTLLSKPDIFTNKIIMIQNLNQELQLPCWKCLITVHKGKLKKILISLKSLKKSKKTNRFSFLTGTTIIKLFYSTMALLLMTIFTKSRMNSYLKQNRYSTKIKISKVVHNFDLNWLRNITNSPLKSIKLKSKFNYYTRLKSDIFLQ